MVFIINVFKSIVAPNYKYSILYMLFVASLISLNQFKRQIVDINVQPKQGLII
jgi:hypothetical protein